MIKTLVIDLGSSIIKVGFSLEKTPSMINNGFNHRYLKLPIRNGVIWNWDIMEKILNFIFNKLSIIPEDNYLLLSICDTSPDQDKLYRLMLEEYKFKKVYIGKQTILSLYALGRSTALLCNIGHDMCQLVPIYKGYLLTHLVKKLALGGGIINNIIYSNLLPSNLELTFEDINELKSKLSFNNENQQYDNNNIILTNGKSITLNNQITKCLEIFLNPNYFNKDYKSLDKEINDLIRNSDMSTRLDLMNNIVLIGGGSLMNGLEDRLNSSLKNLNNRYGKVICEKNREYYEWIGACNLSNLDIFKHLLKSRDDLINNNFTLDNIF